MRGERVYLEAGVIGGEGVRWRREELRCARERREGDEGDL